MNKVQVLPSDVIAKIAAGEVIERPASVVKECVENSLDAGATSIEVHLKDAGKQLIHIKDNGHGIGHADLENLFQRHATSKISAIDDLETLNSLGFRGEALFSIGSIADVVLTSQAKDDPMGWQLHVRGGERMASQPAATSGAGTEIKISEIFFNTPARKKFLKSNTSELNAVVETFLPYTLLNPIVNFKLTHAGRNILDLKPSNSVKERIARSLNLEAKHLIEAEQRFEDEGITIRMVLGNINVQRTRRDLQYIFVNGRPVQSRTLGFHLNDIYRLILPPSVYPFFAVFIELDPAAIDVNIHPAKREVKIANEGRLVSFIRHMVEHTLMTQGDVRSVGGPAGAISQGIPSEQLIYTPGQEQGFFNPAKFFETQTEQHSGERTLAQAEDHLFPSLQETMQAKFGRSRYIGSFINKYLLWESDDSLLLVDQHAAQERIMFEKFKAQIETGRVEVQNLLTPIVLKLTPQERIAWEDTQDALKSVGMDTTAFDDETIAIQTVPTLVKKPENVVRTLLAGEKADRCDHLTIARRACKASVVTGDKLSQEQAEYQRRQLLECRDPFTCPHGRPTVVEIKDDFLERQFLRT
jgi:DNA mismatch repair protein MutL